MLLLGMSEKWCTDYLRINWLSIIVRYISDGSAVMKSYLLDLLFSRF